MDTSHLLNDIKKRESEAMYFIPRNNTKLYSAVAGVRPVYRYLMTAMFLGTITYAWLFGIYFRVQGAIENYGAEITQKRHYCSLGLQAKSEEKKLEESLAYFRNELQHYGKNAINGVQGQIAQLVNVASAAGLTMRSCVVEKEQNDSAWYSQATVTCECTGTLKKIVHFFDLCATSDRLITCDVLRITRNDNNLYDLTCSLHMYSITTN
jgi:hypothetical protein